MRTLILTLAFALAACGDRTTKSEANPEAQAPAAPSLQAMPSWENARAEGVDFRGVGQEPGWMLDLHTDGSAKLIWNYGEQGAAFADVALSYPREGDALYEAQTNEHQLSVLVRRFPCEDAMSGEAYPASVTLTIDGETLQGCGKSV